MLQKSGRPRNAPLPLGTDADVNIATKHPEFSHWKWVEPQLLPELIVPFKRDLYRELLRGFAEYL